MAELCRYSDSESGFTLLEVMIAALLLSLSYVAVLESFSSSMQRLIKLEKRQEAFIRQDLALTETIKFRGPRLDYEESAGEMVTEGTTYSLFVVRSEEGLLESLELRRN